VVGRAGSAPPPLGDGLMPSLTVTVDRSTVKHGTQNIFKIIANDGFLTGLECTKFFFGRGSAPDPISWAYSAPQTL